MIVDQARLQEEHSEDPCQTEEQSASLQSIIAEDALDAEGMNGFAFACLSAKFFVIGRKVIRRMQQRMI